MFFGLTDLVAESGGEFVVFGFDGLSEVAPQFDEFVMLLAGVAGGGFGCAADVFCGLLDILEQGNQAVIEDVIIVGATEASLFAEFLEADAAVGAAFFGFLGEFFGEVFAFANHFFLECGDVRRWLAHVVMKVVFAEVEFFDLSVLQDGDVIDGGLGADVAFFHGGQSFGREFRSDGRAGWIIRVGKVGWEVHGVAGKT